jgi:hypothetical protein
MAVSLSPLSRRVTVTVKVRDRDGCNSFQIPWQHYIKKRLVS